MVEWLEILPTTEAHAPRACVPPQEKPLRWEAQTLQLESRLHLPQLEKSLHSNRELAKYKINENK